MTTAHNKLADGTIELTITIPWVEVQKTYDHVVDEMVQTVELPGFRKGKAPKNLVEPKLDKTKVYEETIKHLVPQAYSDAVTAQKLKPIINPKIELKSAEEGKDWVVVAFTCEKPSVILGNYKQAITDFKSQKQKKIWLPGEIPKPDEEEKRKKPTLDELMTSLYGAVTVALPSLLLENEVNRLLSTLIDQTKKLGLTVEQYLASTNRSADTIRKEYEEQARRSLTVEFALEEIADHDGIIISDDDIDTVLKSAKTDEERKQLEAQRYYIASILRRQKTLDMLASI